MYQLHTVSLPNQRIYFLVIVCIGILMIVFQGLAIKNYRGSTARNDKTVHSILYYNPPSYLQTLHTWSFSSCRYSKCNVTTDKDQLNTSKAVIFYQFPMPPYPPPKREGQRWIFLSKESPINTHNTSTLHGWNKKFDWIMSYRWDGDFYYGYGELMRRTTPVIRNYSAIYSHKKFDVSWIVSHCQTHSRREEYVKELQKHIPVDVFGKCGNLNCGPKTENKNDTCHHLASNNYKFYLAFENSLCRDYTSEKYYFIYLYDMPLIPVVRGAFNGKSYLPEGAFIDANDFDSPKNLADYLKRVGDNETEYINLLKRKDEYVSKQESDILQSSLCKLCERLHSENLASKQYDIKDWYFTDQCSKPTDLNI
jgi:hypothetical protein